MENIEINVEISGSKLLRKEYSYLKYPFVLFSIYILKRETNVFYFIFTLKRTNHSLTKHLYLDLFIIFNNLRVSPSLKNLGI